MEKIIRLIKKITIVLEICIIVVIAMNYLSLVKSVKANDIQVNSELALESKIPSKKYYYMTATAYTRHPDCISPEFNDGYTATGTKVREGIVAINVNLINGRWVVDSVLRLGQKVYITSLENKPLGYFRVEDTGKFKVGDIRGASPDDLRWDRWNCDIFVPNIEKAKKQGCELVKVHIIE